MYLYQVRVCVLTAKTGILTFIEEYETMVVKNTKERKKNWAFHLTNFLKEWGKKKKKTLKLTKNIPGLKSYDLLIGKI